MKKMELVSVLENRPLGFPIRVALSARTPPIVVYGLYEMEDLLFEAYSMGVRDGKQETSVDHSPTNVLGAKRYAKLRDWMAASGEDNFGRLIVVKWPGARIELKQGEDLDRTLDQV